MKAKYMRTPVRLDRALFMHLALDVETILVRNKLNDYFVYNCHPARQGLR